MDPKSLIDSTTTPLPAPVWFIELFKVLGFSLHEVPMNLWYAGVVLAVLLAVAGSRQGKRLSARLMTQMPIIIAMGINFGIVPLLFIQVGYAKVFYPATVLMAWFWLGIIALLIPAYYGVYAYAFGLRDEGRMAAWKRAGGWLAAGIFLAIGFLFANGLSLVENVKSWPDLWQEHSFSGAALGTALNVADPRLWPRWALMFGIALTTTGAWVALDTAWFARREDSEYRAWAKGFAWKVHSLGLVWFAAAGSWYVFSTWSDELQETMFDWPLAALTVATAVSPGVPWLLLAWGRLRRGEIGRGLATLVGLAQFAVLAVNAVSRQVVQNLELQPYYDIGKQSSDTQWSAAALFLGTFVVGLGLVFWMIYQVIKLPADVGSTE